jgi:hypothetical protein
MNMNKGAGGGWGSGGVHTTTLSNWAEQCPSPQHRLLYLSASQLQDRRIPRLMDRLEHDTQTRNTSGARIRDAVKKSNGKSVTVLKYQGVKM